MDLLDTRTKDGNLTGTLIADLVLQIFAYVAQTEREFIHQRQAEGIAAAKANGKKLGRKCKKLPDEFEAVCREHMEGKLTIRAAAEKLNIHHATFYRNYRRFLEKSDTLNFSNSRHYDTKK